MSTVKKLERVVFLAPDISTIGGIQSRIKKTLKNAEGRKIEHLCLSIADKNGLNLDRNLVYQNNPDAISKMLDEWRPSNTVIIFPNNTLRLFPPDLREKIDRFPLIFNGSGQLSFLLQDSPHIADRDYVNGLKVTKIVLFSEMDRMAYSQFGIYDHIKLFHPTEVRTKNPYSTKRNTKFGYVGRIDYHAKGAERLLTAIEVLRKLKRGPLRVYAVDERRGSPHLEDFLAKIEAANLKEHVEIVYNVEDKSKIFADLSVLLLPSKKDSFPNVVLEANSFGVPVIAMAYAPGPAEIIIHRKTGLLLERFSEEILTEAYKSLTATSLLKLSKAAFKHHQKFGFKRYFDKLEKIGEEALEEFDGTNRLPVFPELQAVNVLYEENLRLRSASFLSSEKASKKMAEYSAKLFHRHNAAPLRTKKKKGVVKRLLSKIRIGKSHK
jgi:glycosyltransferase involved in cell wall biosynthesis